MYKILIILSFLGVANAQNVALGACPTVTPKIPFDTNTFFGKWYEISKYVNSDQWGNKCSHTTFYNFSGVTSMFSWWQNGSSVDGTSNYNITFPNNTEGMFTAVLPNAYKGTPTKFYILDTDYAFWSLLYSCYDIMGIVRFEYAWFMYRLRFSVSVLDLAAIAAPHGVQLNNLLMLPSDQFNCPWFY